MARLRKRPSKLKALALTTLYKSFASRLRTLESSSPDLVELPEEQIKAIRNYLGNLPDDNYAEFLEGIVSETRALNCKGSYIELLIVAKRAKKFHYEGGMVDLMRTISIVTGCLPAMRRLEDFKLHINWLPHESIEFVQDNLVSAFQSLRYLQRVDIVGFDLPIGLLTSSLANNCSHCLREFHFQDLDDGAQALGIGDGVYESMAECKQLRALDFKGIADSEGLYEQFLDTAKTHGNLETLGVTLGSTQRGKLIRKWASANAKTGESLDSLRCVTLCSNVAPFADVLARVFTGLVDVALVINDSAKTTNNEQPKKAGILWVGAFTKLQSLSLAFVQATTWATADPGALITPKLTTLRLRGVTDIQLGELMLACANIQHLSLDDCSFASTTSTSSSKTSDLSGRSSSASSGNKPAVSPSLPKLEILRVSNQQQDSGGSGSSALQATKAVVNSSSALQSLFLAIPITDADSRDLFDRNVCEKLRRGGLRHVHLESRNLTSGSVELLLLSLASASVVPVIFDICANFSDKDILRLNKMVKDTNLGASTFSRCF